MSVPFKLHPHRIILLLGGGGVQHKDTLWRVQGGTWYIYYLCVVQGGGGRGYNTKIHYAQRYLMESTAHWYMCCSGGGGGGRNVVLVEGVRTPFLTSGSRWVPHLIRLKIISSSCSYKDLLAHDLQRFAFQWVKYQLVVYLYYMQTLYTRTPYRGLLSRTGIQPGKRIYKASSVLTYSFA